MDSEKKKKKNMKGVHGSTGKFVKNCQTRMCYLSFCDGGQPCFFFNITSKTWQNPYYFVQYEPH